MLLIVAAFALVAPSCPRDFGPRDFDPDATGRFRPFPADADLVYVGGLSAKGDSVYAIAMPGGAIVGRLDGPDRRGWADAGDHSFYTVTRSERGGAATLYRLGPRSGLRSSLWHDSRAATFTPDSIGSYSALLVRSGGELWVARVVRDAAGAVATLTRHDPVTGVPRGERTWPFRDGRGTIRLADLGDGLVAVVIRDLRPNNVPQQLLRVFGPEGRDVAAVDLPGSADCSPDLARIGQGWAVVCTSPGIRTGTATGAAHLLDRAFGIIRSAALELGSGEKGLTWLGTERGLSIITDRARRLVVNADGTVESSLVDAHLAGAHFPAFARLSGDRVVAGWVSTGPGPRAAGVVMISTIDGRVTARLDDPDGPPLGFASAHDRLYTLTSRGSDRWALRRLDPLTLARVGTAAIFPTQDDIHVYGLVSVVPP